MLQAHHEGLQMAGVQHHLYPLPHPRAWMGPSLTPSKAKGRRRRRASLLGSLTEPSTNLCPDLLLRGKTVPQVCAASCTGSYLTLVAAIIWLETHHLDQLVGALVHAIVTIYFSWYRAGFLCAERAVLQYMQSRSAWKNLYRSLADTSIASCHWQRYSLHAITHNICR